MAHLLAVGLFGLFGIFSRWALDVLAGKWFEIFPIGILVINVFGSLIAGVVYVANAERALIPSPIAVGLLVGFCGGFTTFSAYSLQAFLYLEKADLLRGMGYLCISPIFGLLGAFLGVSLARTWF